MSIIENVQAVLEALPEGTVIMISQENGEPLNVAIRAQDLAGDLSWALAGKPNPYASVELARIITTRGYTWNEMELAW